MAAQQQDVSPRAASSTAPVPKLSEVDLYQLTTTCVQKLRTAEKISLETLVRVVDGNCNACEELAAHAAHKKTRVANLKRQAELEMAKSGSLSAEEGSLAQELFSEFLVGTSDFFAGTTNDLFGTLGFLGAAPDVRTSAEPTSVQNNGRRQQMQRKSAPEASSRAPEATVSSFLSATQAKPATTEDARRPRESEGVDVDEVLEELRNGPRRATREAARLLDEFENLRRRFAKLRSSWPSIRENIRRAFGTDQPLQTKSLSWTLAEALSWHRGMKTSLRNADVLCSRMEDFVECCRQEKEDRRQLRAKSLGLLCGLEDTVAARIAALTWLRRADAYVNAYKDGCHTSGREEEVLEGQEGIFGRNLEAAEYAASRLVKCAAAVMMVEREHAVVQDAVGRLNALKTELLETTDAATTASDALHSRSSSGGTKYRGKFLVQLIEDAVTALTDLHGAVDEANEALSDCPFQFLRKGGKVFPEKPDAKDVEALRKWIHTSLCNDDEDD